MRPQHIPSILSFTKMILTNAIAHGDIAVDATAGNGYDTAFLADLVGESGHVFAFDIQQEAVLSTQKRLEKAGMLKRATLFACGHEQVHTRIPMQFHGSICAAMFNLGYLPGSDKTTITRAENTLAALKKLLPMLKTGGIISIHQYTGHEGGEVEATSVTNWAKALSWKNIRVCSYDFPNKEKNKEILLVIEKFAEQS